MGPLHIVFLHMDLGIGGAEQLVINLALASLNNETTDLDQEQAKRSVSIFTTHCSQTHCFDAVRKHPNNPGRLANDVHLVGTFLPADILGFGRTFCSTLRMFYLSVAARWMYPHADVFVLDVLPTSLPYLVLGNGGVKSTIFYCHFPDKLLKRDMINGLKIQKETTNITLKNQLKSYLQDIYRLIMNRLEEWSMSYADVICVNSQFTLKETLRAFPSIHRHAHDEQKDTNMKVLYPAIDLNKFIPPNFDQKRKLLENRTSPIVSLNRFERKKNVEVLLKAYAILKERCIASSITLPPLVIAGGYDPNNNENVEYLVELQFLAAKLKIKEHTAFLRSVSDEKRASLLQSALCVVYTPFREHFGIVPLEAMFAGTAVVAMKSGGPMETCVQNVTGVLVDIDDLEQNLADALHQLVIEPNRAIEMGVQGHEHVKSKFGLDNFQKQWIDIVENHAIPLGKERRATSIDKRRYPLYIMAIIIIIIAVIVQQH